jgi:hypothetical protein
VRVLIVAAELSPATLFDLVVMQDVSSVLDLRAVNCHAPRILDHVYHRPPKVLAGVIFRRVMSDWCKVACTQPHCNQYSSNHTLMMLVDHERIDDMRSRVLALRSDAQIEVIGADVERNQL